MTFENQYVRVVASMDPQEGQRYIEPIKDEVSRSWDHAYNISEDYIHPIVDGVAQVLCPLILMMLWKTGRIGCMKYHSGNVG